MSALMDKAISHDQISRMLNRPTTGAGRLVADRQAVCANDAEGVKIDGIVEKPYTDENVHYDHAQAGMVKGINFITALYTVGEVS